jgi:hypothetical protein
VDTASVDNPWIISACDKPLAMEIVLLKQTVVLSWNQFVYAEGGDDEIRIAFASHDVIVKGSGLLSLLHAITSHQVASVREPARSERFPSQASRSVREIAVRRVDAD